MCFHWIEARAKFRARKTEKREIENGKENAKESDQLENDWHEAGRDDGFEAGLLVDPGPDDELGVGTTRPVWANQKLLLRLSSFEQNVIWFSDKESISIISNKAAMYYDANY